MTEGSEDGWLVRIRAQVMSRDEGTGGWVAVDGGGLANVMVGKRPSNRGIFASQDIIEESTSRHSVGGGPLHEYYIYGKRICDGTELLSCTIKKDFQYNKVMPTFHHWVTDEKRFGLTFQTAADARAFDRGVKTAVDEILNGVDGSWFIQFDNSTSGHDHDEDSNIFECLDLPSDKSGSETSTTSRIKHDNVQTPILSAIMLPDQNESFKQFQMAVKEPRRKSDGEPPYVDLTAVHEYNYPTADYTIISQTISPCTRPPESGALKFVAYRPPLSPELPMKKPKPTFQARLRCRYCHTWYLESANTPGVCDGAPDPFQTCINTVSCLKCAQGVVYHCMSDSEGDFALRPCACQAPNERCVKRFLCVGFLSLFVPCLCCYLPLKGVKETAAAIGLHKPGMHKPISTI